MLLYNIQELVQVRENQTVKLSGTAMSELPTLKNSFLKIDGDKISDFGIMAEMPAAYYDDSEKIDASGRFVFPGYVDSHTHLVFATSREEEFVMKIRGMSYADIAAKGGGILNSAKKLRELSEEELFKRTLQRVDEIIRSGTVALEIKSGYGLNIDAELKMLRVARRIGRETPLTVKTTFLGAHAVPSGVSKEQYIGTILNEMIPAVADEELADYIDVFCETGFFTPDETEKIVERGKQFGMQPRIHANQLGRSGGVQVGVKTKAKSVDHLEHIDDEEIICLKNSEVMPTALPGAAFFLNLPFPPARKIIDSGLPLAIASDFNPGSAPTGNMNLMLSLACVKMKMTPEEAFNAATINTAWAIDLQSAYGSISKGKVASVCITKPIPSIAYIPYRFGNNLIERVILKGKLYNSEFEL